LGGAPANRLKKPYLRRAPRVRLEALLRQQRGMHGVARVRPACSAIVMVPKFCRRPLAIEAAMPRPRGRVAPEFQQPAARGGDAEDSQGARHVPARLVQAGIELASQHDIDLEARDVGQQQLCAAEAA